MPRWWIVGILLVGWAMPCWADNTTVYNPFTSKLDYTLDIADAGDVTATSVTLENVSTTQVIYAGVSGLLVGDNDFTYDDDDNILAIRGSGQRVYGPKSYIDFDDGGFGTLTFASSNSTFNEKLKLDLESGQNKIVLSSPTEANQLIWDDKTIVMGQFITGGGGTFEDWNVNSLLLAFYKLDDNAASTTVTDTTGSFPGTANTSTSALTTEGQVGQAFSFNGSTTSVDLGTSSSLIPTTGDFSVECWIRTTKNDMRIVSDRSATGDTIGYSLQINPSGKFVFLLDNGPTVTTLGSTTQVNDDAWHHLVATRSSGTIRVYVDGILEASGSTGGDIGTGAGPNTWIGRGNASGNFFNGSIDNVRIYNDDLTVTQITGLYNFGDGTIALSETERSTATYQIIADSLGSFTGHDLNDKRDLYVQGQVEIDDTLFVDALANIDQVQLGGGAATGPWDADDNLKAFYKFEENAASQTVVDSAGLSSGTSVLTTDQKSVTGKLGSAFTFRNDLGTPYQDFVDLGDDADLKITGNITIETWLKTSSNNMRAMGNRSNTGTQVGWDLGVRATGLAGCLFDTGPSAKTIQSTTRVDDDLWHHIVCVREGQDMRIYVDGVSQGTPSGKLSATGNIGTGSGNTHIGRAPIVYTGGVTTFDGELDNIRIYAEALTTNEIEQLYASGQGTVETSGSAGADTDVQLIGAGSSIVVQNASVSTGGDLVVESDLEVQDNVYLSNFLILGPQAIVMSETTGATPTTVTLTPTSSYITLECADPDTCDATMSESGIISGTIVYLVNATTSGYFVDFADTADVQDVSGPTVNLGQWDTLTLLYSMDQWLQVGHSEN